MANCELIRTGAMPGDKQAAWQRRVTQKAEAMRSLQAQCRRIADLLVERMQAVEESSQAAFLGFAGPCSKGELELLFIARKTFGQGTQKCIWMDMTEGGFSAKGWGGARVIASTWSVASDEAVLESVKIRVPDEAELALEFSDFIRTVLARPLADSFYEADRAEIQAEVDFFVGNDMSKLKDSAGGSRCRRESMETFLHRGPA